MTTEEKKEEQYLTELLCKIDVRMEEINDTIRLKQEEIKEMDKHMEDHKRDMDHLEKNALRETISNYQLLGKHSVETQKRLLRLKDIAYFGRIDFATSKKRQPSSVYVGVHNFQDAEKNKNLVYDWRAPISSLFYDYELGEARYKTESGIIEGDIKLKRQFRIRNGEMKYMLDTDLTIHDDVLQKELNQASSAKMKNIVATIQKEQNAIIRDEESAHLIIQGVAGSGKTSIALHRIAYLLYRFKETLSSEDILILSPNKVFANYISNVLPELGEENIAEVNLEEIADGLFEYQIKFQSFHDQVAELLEKNNTKLIERIQFKSSHALLDKIDDFIVHLENEGFKVDDIVVKGKPVPAWFIEESFQKYSRLPLLKRFNEVVKDIVENVFRYYQVEVQYKDRTELHKTIRNMFPSYNLRVLYKLFYEWLEKPELLKLKKGTVYEWSDVFALLYLKMRLEGLEPDDKIKHLVVDEMQDYSAVQYHVLSNLYPCKKTILGDINQSVNPFSSSDLSAIENTFPDATSMTMLKSYRSTFEITQFSKKINPDTGIEVIERHGKEPELVHCKNETEEIKTIKAHIEAFEKGNYNSLGIVCKTQKQANNLYQNLMNDFDVNLLDTSSAVFKSGIILTTAYLAKGLEFDVVIIPKSSEKNYHTMPDKQMLYVACTRAMHELTLTYTGQLSSLLN